MVDLQLRGLAQHASQVRPRLSPLLEADMSIRVAGKSLAVSIKVPAFHPQSGFEPNRAAAEAGMHAAARLQAWYRVKSRCARRDRGGAASLMDAGHTPASSPGAMG